MPINQSNPVIVLGMHRSGTSVLTHCLIKLGVNMGDDKNMLQPDEGNPLGYFEDRDFLELNKAIIRDAGGEWSMPTSRKALYGIERKYRKQMSELLHDRLSGNIGKYWGWKDPRNCLTAWIWHKHLSTQNVRYIAIYRNRQAIMKSLIKRNQDLVNWSRLAKAYGEHLSIFIKRDMPKIHIVHYEDLTKNQEKAFQTITEVAKFLGMKINNNKIWKAVDVVRFDL